MWLEHCAVVVGDRGDTLVVEERHRSGALRLRELALALEQEHGTAERARAQLQKAEQATAQAQARFGQVQKDRAFLQL